MSLLLQSADSLVAPDSTAITSVRQLMPSAPPTPLESVMLQQDKMYVVAAVVLIIWLGVLALLYANDRRLARLERTLAQRPSGPGRSSPES